MATSDNITFEMSFDSKTKALMEKYTKTTEQLTKIMQATGKTDATMELKAAELKHKTEMMKTSNVQEENKAAESDRRNTHQLIEQGRLNRLDIKYKKEFLLQETRQKNKMILAEKRHFNEMMERMVSGGTATKLIGMATMGAGAAKKGGGMLSGAIGQQAKKSAMWRGLKLETGEMSQAENEERAGGISIGFGDHKAKEVTRKTQGFLRDNKMGQGIVKAMEKSKIFNEKAGAALGKAKGGLGIAGIGALGIGGSIITKAIESSPIAQSMMKIMSTAFTLILRPIGDFFGGVMKPIALRLLKFGAENVGQGASLFKMGEKVGIAALALFTDPAAVFGMLAERLGATIAIEARALVDPFFNKTEAYGKMLGNFDEKMAEIAGVTGGFESLVTQASQQVISGIDNVNKTTTEGFSEIIAKTDEAAKKLEEKQNRESGIFGGYGSKDEQQSELERLMAESKAQHGAAWANAESGMGDIRGGQGMSDSHAEAYLGATDKVKEILTTINTGLSDEAVQIIATFEMMKEAGILGNQKHTELREAFATAVEEGTGLYADIEQQNTAHMLIKKKQEETQVDYEEKITAAIQKTSEEMAVAERILAATIARMKQLNNKSSQSHRRENKNATGGMITEPVIGIGQHTGETWSFGERGMEYVTPNTAFGGSTNNYDQKNNVVINITIDKVTGNTDLQQIKPIVERALRESHSRRGII